MPGGSKKGGGLEVKAAYKMKNKPGTWLGRTFDKIFNRKRTRNLVTGGSNITKGPRRKWLRKKKK
tara:strand:+ start:47 stop:241 length:195 start_codon:yes stop_codon:yes gene_type:complete